MSPRPASSPRSSRRRRHVATLPLGVLAGLALIALASAVATAGTTAPLSPDPASSSTPSSSALEATLLLIEPAFQLPEPEPTFLAELPWLTPADTKPLTWASWFWNSHYRGGLGVLALTTQYHIFTAGGFEFPPLITGTNNDVNGADFEEIFVGLNMQGVLYPGVAVQFEFGGHFTNVQYPDSDVVQYGLGAYFGIGLSLAVPLSDVFTLVGDVLLRHWNADQDEESDPPGSTVKTSFVGNRFNYELKLFMEVVRNPKGASFDFYAGFGGHVHRGDISGASWTVPGRDMQDFDVVYGFVLMFGTFGIRGDVRYPFNLDARLSLEASF